MEGLIQAVQIILALSLLVLIHEFGHFFMARLFGVRVERFFIFFDVGGFALWKKKFGHTVVGIGWLPLGGYVKVAGMEETLTKRHILPAPWEFGAKPVWQRLLIILGGILMNVLFALILYPIVLKVYYPEYHPISVFQEEGLCPSGFGRDVGFLPGDLPLTIDGQKIERLEDLSPVVWLTASSATVLRGGMPVTIMLPDTFPRMFFRRGLPPVLRPCRWWLVVDSVVLGSPAERAGLQKGDTITHFNDTAVGLLTSPEEFFQWKKRFRGDTVRIRVRRSIGGITDLLVILPDTSDQMGFSFQMVLPYGRARYTWWDVWRVGARELWWITVGNAAALMYVVRGWLPLRETIHSPIALARLYAPRFDWGRFWRITALFSIILAFINLLPIPTLDGGHALFLLYEMVTGRKPHPRVAQWLSILGFVFLVLLMLFAISKDIWMLIRG